MLMRRHEKNRAFIALTLLATFIIMASFPATSGQKELEPGAYRAKKVRRFAPDGRKKATPFAPMTLPNSIAGYQDLSKHPQVRLPRKISQQYLARRRWWYGRD